MGAPHAGQVEDAGERRAGGSGKRRPATDEALAQQADYLSRTYLDGRAVPTSVRWVTNQNSRWGSATPADGTIRLSHKLQPMPQWVIDYVLLHETAHLLVAGHTADFWRLLRPIRKPSKPRVFSKESPLPPRVA